MFCKFSSSQYWMDSWIFWGFVLVWFSFFFTCKYIAKMKRKKSTILKIMNCVVRACGHACMHVCPCMCMYVSVHVLAYMCILEKHMIPNPNLWYCPRSSCKTFHPPNKAITVTELLASWINIEEKKTFRSHN